MLIRHAADYEPSKEDADVSRYVEALDREQDNLRSELGQILGSQGIPNERVEAVLAAVQHSNRRALAKVKAREPLALDEDSSTVAPSMLFSASTSSSRMEPDDPTLLGIGGFADEKMINRPRFSGQTDLNNLFLPVHDENFDAFHFAGHGSTDTDARMS